MITLVFTWGLLVLSLFDLDSEANLTSKARLGYSQLHDEDEALDGVSCFATNEKLWRELFCRQDEGPATTVLDFSNTEERLKNIKDWLDLKGKRMAMVCVDHRRPLQCNTTIRIEYRKNTIRRVYI